MNNYKFAQVNDMTYIPHIPAENLYNYTIPNIYENTTSTLIQKYYNNIGKPYKNNTKYDYIKQWPFRIIYNFISSNPLDSDERSKLSKAYIQKREDFSENVNMNGSEYNPFWLLFLVIISIFFIHHFLLC